MLSEISTYVVFPFPLGFIIAAICSYARNKSIAWALVHAVLLGWIYVIYWALTGETKKDD